MPYEKRMVCEEKGPIELLLRLPKKEAKLHSRYI
jgi:hypothetical protein